MAKKKIDFKLLAITFITLFLLTIVGIVAFTSSYALNDSIYGGVKISGRELGGMSKIEAERAVSSDIAKIRQQPILKIKFAEQSWNVKDTDIDWSVDVKELIEEAYSVGRTGNILERLHERFSVYNRGKDISFVGSYNKSKLAEIIAELAKALFTKPKNASIAIVAGVQNIMPEINGVQIDEQAALSLAEKAINEHLVCEIVLPATITPPEITQDKLKNITDILGSYTTHYNAWLRDRSHNVELASNYLDGKLLKPGEVFSFNEAIGQRSVSMGYRDAPVYIGEEIVPGIGGGICQVSSTLYNAVLLGNFTIVERENHIRPVTYAPIGQDATIAGDIIDFRFVNNTNENIYVRSITNYNELTVEILGKKPADFPSVKITSENLQVLPYKSVVKQDKKMPVGMKKVEREGENGYKVTTYRLKYQGNKLLAREKLYDDYYPVIDEIVIVGAKIPDNAGNKDDDEKNTDTNKEKRGEE